MTSGKLELFLIAAVATLVVTWIYDMAAPKIGLPALYA